MNTYFTRPYTNLSLNRGKEERGKGGYTDHNPLIMEIVVPSKKRCKTVFKRKNSNKTKKYDLGVLQNEEIRDQFCQKLGEKLVKDGSTIV